MGVAGADAGGGDPHQDLLRARFVELQFTEPQWVAVLLQHGSVYAHDRSLSGRGDDGAQGWGKARRPSEHEGDRPEEKE
ncbi:hypothetical protein GCM10027271_44610 [Saccharopolyspora gloriosae]